VHLRHLWLTDFRSYPAVDLELPRGLCAVIGRNGTGKTNLLEAVGYLSSLRSFRGAPSEALVRSGAERSIVRGELERDGREILIEAEIGRVGRNRVLLNRQRLARTRDLHEAIAATVFSPDDLDLVKGGPGSRRGFLDDALVTIHPRNDAIRSEWERALKQRNALLKQMRTRPDETALLTLEVWDDKATAAGEALAELRTQLVDDLGPHVARAYLEVAASPGPHDVTISLRYDAPWRETGLRAALVAARDDELRRGVTLAGPHRDELVIVLNGLPARTHASQGEQRSLALALRLATHRLATERAGTAPILLLDDVFSELDAERSAALLDALPGGQTLLSSAAGLPSGVVPDRLVEIQPGRIVS